jgi:hypothetical protein
MCPFTLNPDLQGFIQIWNTVELEIGNNPSLLLNLSINKQYRK